MSPVSATPSPVTTAGIRRNPRSVSPHATRFSHATHGDRWLVHVPPVEVPRRREEVQLVTVVAVPRGDHQQERNRSGRDAQHGAGRERR
jgi:hypothetical protein